MAECPVCSSGIELGENTLKGELVTCTQCGTELEVASINPIALKRSPRGRRLGNKMKIGMLSKLRKRKCCF